MQTIAIIGYGAIAEAVRAHLVELDDVEIGVVIAKPGGDARARRVFGETVEIAHDLAGVRTGADLFVDCAGHSALRQHGADVLHRGIDLITVSSGALADAELYAGLVTAARAGGAQLRIAGGAIGGLDALGAASVGRLAQVTYRGRKPPRGWRGSPAESKLDLDALTEATVHFTGNARDAALEYPKNANVAASVALAGIGFDDTEVELIADPGIDRNVHEIIARGDFGRCEFCIEGMALPGNPRSSAITAMSVVREILGCASPIVI
jgi:aspartate dehydrogenase